MSKNYQLGLLADGSVLPEEEFQEPLILRKGEISLKLERIVEFECLARRPGQNSRMSPVSLTSTDGDITLFWARRKNASYPMRIARRQRYSKIEVSRQLARLDLAHENPNFGLQALQELCTNLQKHMLRHRDATYFIVARCESEM